MAFKFPFLISVSNGKNVKHGQINRIDFSYMTESLDVIHLNQIYENQNTSCSLTRNFNWLWMSQFCQHYKVTCDIMGLGKGGGQKEQTQLNKDALWVVVFLTLGIGCARCLGVTIWFCIQLLSQMHNSPHRLGYGETKLLKHPPRPFGTTAQFLTFSRQALDIYSASC